MRRDAPPAAPATAVDPADRRPPAAAPAGAGEGPGVRRSRALLRGVAVLDAALFVAHATACLALRDGRGDGWAWSLGLSSAVAAVHLPADVGAARLDRGAIGARRAIATAWLCVVVLLTLAGCGALASAARGASLSPRRTAEAAVLVASLLSSALAVVACERALAALGRRAPTPWEAPCVPPDAGGPLGAPVAAPSPVPAPSRASRWFALTAIPWFFGAGVEFLHGPFFFFVVFLGVGVAVVATSDLVLDRRSDRRLRRSDRRSYAWPVVAVLGGVAVAARGAWWLLR